MNSLNHPNTQTIRIAHIDDEPSCLEITKKFIRRYDPYIQIESYVNPETILKKINTYDCIVTDYRMPKMHGIQLVKKIREKSDIPIILYTGKGSEEVASAAYEAGIDDYIRKEFETQHYQVLVMRIRSAVEKYRALKDLEASELKYKTLVENSIQGILIVQGPSPNITYANTAMEQISGFTSEELTSMPPEKIAELIHLEHRTDIIDNMTARLEGKPSSQRYEIKAHTKDGQLKRLEIYSTRIEYEKNPALQVAIIDRTENK